MHEEVKRFPLEGAITDDLNVVEHKARLVHFVEGVMRDEGYVPLLDMEPQYNQWYDAVGEHYEFKLSVYGVYVGKDKECRIAGMMNGKPIALSTLPIR
jgi:hypothetical protein